MAWVEAGHRILRVLVRARRGVDIGTEAAGGGRSREQGALVRSPHGDVYVVNVERPADAADFYEAFAHGAELVSYFRWRQAPFAQEQMHAGLLRPDHRDAPAAAGGRGLSSRAPAMLAASGTPRAMCP